MSAFRLFFLLLIGGLLWLPYQAQAQTTGVVSGRITDASTGEALPGASVVIRGTTIGTSTSVDGRYRIANVPAGSHTLVASYIGFATEERPVAVTAGRELVENFRLVDTFLEGQDIIVIGILQGQARAFNQQKNAENIRNVVSSEQLEKFPDPNLAAAMQRIAGISTSDDRGEASDVSIRGLHPSMVNVTVNGERMATTGVTDRRVNIAGISREMISSIEVSKAITPDMDADAIGGSINLVTRRPVGDRTLFNIATFGGHNTMIPDRTGFRTAMTYGQRYGNLGMLLNASFSRDPRRSEDNQPRWRQRTINGVHQDVLHTLETGTYISQRERYGVSGQLDYEFNDNNSIFLRGMLNQYYDKEQRLRYFANIAQGSYISHTETTNSRFERQGRDYSQDNLLHTITAGGRSMLSNLSVDYSLSYSRGEYHEPFRDYYDWRLNNVGITYEISDPIRPKLISTSVDVNDPSLYTLNFFERRLEDSRDRDYIGSVNFELPYRIADSQARLKWGGKFYSKNKNRQHSTRRWGFDGLLTMNGFTMLESRKHLGIYDLGPVLDWKKARGHFESNPNLYIEDVNRTHQQSDPNTYAASENVGSLYGMTTVNVGNLMILGGVRMENTRTEYSGNEVVFDAQNQYVSTNRLTGGRTYTDFFPMVHLRYSMGLFSNVRAAWTNSIARPNFFHLAPREYIQHDLERVTRGNPNLDPLRSMNLDLLVEHYFPSVGVLSGGIFFKDITGFIYTEVSNIEDGSPYHGWELRRPVNGETAKVYGFEAAWQQQLTFLPGALKGLGVYANYSYTHSRADVGDRWIRMIGQSPHIANAALSYQRGGFAAQVSANYQDTRLSTLNQGITGHPDLFDRFDAATWVVDASANQRLLPYLRLFVEVNNLTNTPRYNYYGDPLSRAEMYPYRYRRTGTQANIGVRFDL